MATAAEVAVGLAIIVALFRLRSGQPGSGFFRDMVQNLFHALDPGQRAQSGHLLQQTSEAATQIEHADPLERAVGNCRHVPCSSASAAAFAHL